MVSGTVLIGNHFICYLGLQVLINSRTGIVFPSHSRSGFKRNLLSGSRAISIDSHYLPGYSKAGVLIYSEDHSH